MAVTVKYSSIFFLVAAVSLTVIILLGVLDYYGTHNLIINYCQSAGFRYEERLFRGLWRGYCIFDNVNCLSADCYLGGNCISDIDAVDIVYSTSECFAVDFFRGGCTPCLFPVFNCSRFEGVEVCPQNLEPVCARIRVGVVEPFVIEERTVGNACTACINSKPTALVTSYVNKSCDYPT